MITKYRTKERFYGEKIEIKPCFFDRETDCFLFSGNWREKKQSVFYKYHDSFGDAKQYLIDKFNKEVDEKRKALERVEKALRDIYDIMPEG